MVTTSAIISQKISNFPLEKQQEVLNYVEFLETKLKTQPQINSQEINEEKGWLLFLSLEKDGESSQISDISNHVDHYLYQK